MSREKKRSTAAIWLITLLLLPIAATAQNDFYDNADPDWRFKINFGFGAWESQQNLDTAGPGEFDQGPVVLEIGVDYRLTEWGRTDVYLGLDAGIMTTQSDIPGQFTSPTSDADYFIPSLVFYFGDVGSTRVNLRAGVGRYSVEFSELIDYTNLNRTFSETAFGTSVGAGLDFPLQVGSGLNSITLDTRVHFVDFGEVVQLGPNAGNLEGPIWTIQLGWARRF